MHGPEARTKYDPVPDILGETVYLANTSSARLPFLVIRPEPS
jgi:hypothetical protein